MSAADADKVREQLAKYLSVRTRRGQPPDTLLAQALVQVSRHTRLLKLLEHLLGHALDWAGLDDEIEEVINGQPDRSLLKIKRSTLPLYEQILDKSLIDYLEALRSFGPGRDDVCVANQLNKKKIHQLLEHLSRE